MSSERVGLLLNTQRLLHYIGRYGQSVGLDNLTLQAFGVSSVDWIDQDLIHQLGQVVRG